MEELNNVSLSAESSAQQPDEAMENFDVPPAQKEHINEEDLPQFKQHFPTDLSFDFSKSGVSNFLKYMSLLIFLAFLRAISTYVFIIPNGFAPGGIGGISSILYNAVGIAEPSILENRTLDMLLDAGLTTFIMNVPILIAAFIKLNKKFAINTFFVIAFYTAFMMLFKGVKFPQYYADGDTGLKIIAALVGGVITGFCLGMMLRTNMSMGGTDIIGKFIYKHNPSAGAMWWILICDCIVVSCSGILGILEIVGQPNVSPTNAMTAILSPILFSFLSLIVCSLTADFLQSGFQSSLVFNIITDKPNQIANAITTTLHRGVTISHAVGFYTGVEHEVLVCVVSKKQINVVKNIIQSVDPKAFTYITKANEVAGKGFLSSKES